MNAITETVDKPDGVCQQVAIEPPFSENEDRAGVGRRDAADGKTSSKFSHGGPRVNSGGARPNCGGPQPGSGRPRKIQPIAPTQIRYASNDPQWCVFAVWGQAETSAVQELTRQGYETYLPMVAIRRRDAVILTKWHIVRVPLIPGYGFIRMQPSESREPITATRGVREVLLRPDGRPARATDAEIEKLQGHDESRLKLPKRHGSTLDKETHVRVEDGPFASFPGVVMECDGVKTRVEVFIFGRATPVWMDRVAVEVVA